MKKAILLPIAALFIFCLTACDSTDEALLSGNQADLLSAQAQSEIVASDEAEPIETPSPEPTLFPEPDETSIPPEEDNTVTVGITVGTQTFSAEFYENETARAFAAMLPLELDMTELNGNEKCFYLDSSLPANASRPDGIYAGDLMLYGSECIVLFYESFSTSYSYTPIGRVQDPESLAAALGGGDVTVSFSIN